MNRIAATVVGLGTLGGPLGPTALPQAFADARLNAPTAAGTRVNRDAESLLRFGLPFESKEARALQDAVENVKNNLKVLLFIADPSLSYSPQARRIEFAKRDVSGARATINKNRAKLLAVVPPNHRAAAEASLDKISAGLEPLESAIASEGSTSSGSLQQRDAYDTAFAAQEAVARELSTFEELLVPDDFRRPIPAEYKGLPALQGRAEVEMVLRRPDGSQYDVEGRLFDEVRLRMVVDGYNAPLTGGNFVDLINRGFYNKKTVTRADGFVVQAGDADPAGEVHGFVPPGQSEERK